MNPFKLFGGILRRFGSGIEKMGFSLQGSNAFREELNRTRRLMNLGSKKPNVGAKAWVAPNASVIGNVELGDRSSVWYGAIVRGDANKITIGKNSSIGDRVMIHAASGQTGTARETLIGENVVIESGAIIHACTIHDNSKVGMGSILLDGVVVGKGSIVAPGSLVPQGKHIPDGEVWSGSPAKLVRKLSENEAESLSQLSQKLIQLAEEHELELSRSRTEKIVHQDSRNIPESRDPLI